MPDSPAIPKSLNIISDPDVIRAARIPPEEPEPTRHATERAEPIFQVDPNRIHSAELLRMINVVTNMDRRTTPIEKQIRIYGEYWRAFGMPGNPPEWWYGVVPRVTTPN